MCINHLVQGNRVIFSVILVLHIYMMFTQWFNIQHMASHGACALVSAATPCKSSACALHSLQGMESTIIYIVLKQKKTPVLLHWPMLRFTNSSDWPQPGSGEVQNLSWKLDGFSQQATCNRLANFRFSSVFQPFLFANAQIMLEKYSIMLF